MPNSYEIEIVNFNTIEGGIEVFARAWKNGAQLGFGKDGTIDIERFRIFNPPILVDDPIGTIVFPSRIESGLEIPERRLREDADTAIKQSLVHTLSVVGKDGANIVTGKIGNTTSTFYTNGGDGVAQRGNQATWTAARDTADSVGVQTTATVIFYSEDESAAANDYANGRGFFPFDTATIPDTDTIDSATLSFSVSDVGTGTRSIGVVESTHQSTSTLVVGDYDTLTVDGATEGATRVTVSATGYKDMTLNSSGLGWIDKTGFSGFAIRHSFDLDNTTPVFGTHGRNYIFFYTSVEAGTTNDPKLVVVHSAATTNSNFFQFL